MSDQAILPFEPVAAPAERWFPVATERLVLREFTAADLDDIQAYAEDPEVVRYMEWGPNTLKMTREVLERWLNDQRTWPRLAVNLAVELRASARPIGAVRLDVRDPANRSGDMGYSFNRSAWGQGLGSEAAAALVRVAFDVLGLHRLWATCDVRNAGSAGVLERIGMRREGLLRGHLQGRDGWRDSYLYAMLAEDWIALSAPPRNLR
jgi:RimJ/RimL family protein N-acetyltransferase